MKNAMKIVLVGVMALFCVNEAMAGSFTDPRDGKKYKTVKMPDGKTWMAENLNYNMSGSVCYDNDASNCNKYGRLYTWEAAMKACPSGWHLPSKGDFDTMLKKAVGNDDSKKLRASSWGETWTSYKAVCARYACSYGYGSTIRDCSGSDRCDCGSGESICLENKREKVNYDSRGSDSFGFSVLPAGYYYNGNSKNFRFLGEIAHFWASTEYNSYDAFRLYVDDDVARVGNDSKAYEYSVRCLQGSN